MKNTQIFHFTWPFQTVLTCPNPIIKTEKHCAKYVQSDTKNRFCETKCVIFTNVLIFYDFYFSPLFEFVISIAFLFYFYCYTISILYIQVSTLIFYIATLISCILCISTQIPDQDFKKIVTLVQKRTFRFVVTT